MHKNVCYNEQVMKRRFLLPLMVALFAVMIFAQNGDATRQKDDKSVIDEALIGEAGAAVYAEDKSPVKDEEKSTAAELLEVGRHLASGTASNGKYLAARAAGGGNTFRSADVIFVGEKALVTTTRCLFLIVAGYLEEVSQLKGDAAYKAAQSICYWNSAHYGDSAYFAGLFGEGVNAPFAEHTKSIGLSLSYKEWRGKARIVVPWAADNSGTAVKQAAESNAFPSESEGTGKSSAVDDALLSGTGKAESTHSEGDKKDTIEEAKYVPKGAPKAAAEGSAISQYLPLSALPNGVLVLLGTLCLAILMLLFLLVKVIMDLARDR